MMSCVRVLTLTAILVAVFAAFFTIDIFKPYRQIVLNYLSRPIKGTTTDSPLKPGKLFTKEELSKFKGIDGPVYLAVLGHVFDVTKGKRHYGPGGGYEFFAGRDGSRGYVTGEFNDKGLIDDITGFTLGQIHTLQHWLQFYNKDYTFIGYVIGSFFDKNGNPTQMKLDYDSKLVDANKEQENKEEDIRRYPPCNSEFKAGHGRRLWCSNFSGGIHRDWVGLPRQFFRPGETHPRCACVKNIGPPSDKPGASNHKNNGDLDNPNMKLYENCDPLADSCFFPE